jgi:hypothetical protein
VLEGQTLVQSSPGPFRSLPTACTSAVLGQPLRVSRRLTTVEQAIMRCVNNGAAYKNSSRPRKSDSVSAVSEQQRQSPSAGRSPLLSRSTGSIALRIF